MSNNRPNLVQQNILLEHLAEMLNLKNFNQNKWLGLIVLVIHKLIQVNLPLRGLTIM